MCGIRGLMKRLLCAGVCLVLCCACMIPLRATDPVYADGEVLFAARYGDYTSLRDTGVRFGSSSWSGRDARLSDGYLRVQSSSDQKTYLLLPEEIPHTDTYTVVFTFRFSDVSEEGGYCGFLLSSSGDAPSNRMEVILRASGACVQAGQFGKKIAAALADGEDVRVEIPIRHGMMTEITATAGSVRETLKLENVRAVPEGRRGFVFRNASCDIRKVKIVCGVGYKEETGFYAENSYIAPPTWEEPIAPPTFDGWWLPAVPAILSGVILWAERRRRA